MMIHQHTPYTIHHTPTYISSCSINACTDATLTSFVTNNLLLYNGSKWINSTMSLEMNIDVNVSSLTNKILFVGMV